MTWHKAISCKSISNPSHTRENNMSLYASKPIDFVKSEYSKRWIALSGPHLLLSLLWSISVFNECPFQYQKFKFTFKIGRFSIRHITQFKYEYSRVELSPNSKRLWTIILPWDKYDYQNSQMVQTTVQISFKKRCQRWWLDSNLSANISMISWLWQCLLGKTTSNVLKLFFNNYYKQD